MSDTYFEYYAIGTSTAQQVPVSLDELALNIVTDWMPGTPSPLARGFSDLLAKTLTPITFGSDDYWTVDPYVEGFDNQWRATTSWVLGVAFCRKVVEMEGYPWWAPVSAFKKPKLSVAHINHWQSKLPVSNCEVTRPNANTLFPDYVLATISSSSSSGYAISFAESKGSPLAIRQRNAPPTDWQAQSKNAEFIHLATKYSVKQHLLIATRVNPRAVKAENRKIIVRAWNSKLPDSQVPFETLRHVVLIHYLGICVQLGMTANAHLLGYNESSERMNETGGAEPTTGQISLQERQRLINFSRGELSTQSNLLGNAAFFFPEQTPPFAVGDRVVQIGLTEGAIDLINWLQGLREDSGPELISRVRMEAHRLKEVASGRPNLIIRSDGVVGAIL
ncbi:MAG: hypothetical protein QOD00_2022 [Blastocatellia bacterium]|nr:hypothetical protein [Blastocatellia bacterium]